MSDDERYALADDLYDAFAAAQAAYDNATPPEPAPAAHETRVFRATVFLTYNGYTPDTEDEPSVEQAMSPSMMEQDAKRVLSPRNWVGGLKLNRMLYVPDNVEVVDGQWMSLAESEEA